MAQFDLSESSLSEMFAYRRNQRLNTIPLKTPKILTYNIVSNCGCASCRIAGTGLFAILLGRCGFGLICGDALSLDATRSSGLVIWYVRARNNRFGPADAGRGFGWVLLGIFFVLSVVTSVH